MIRKNAAPEDIKPGIQAGKIKGDVSRRGPDRGRKIRTGGPWQKGKCVAATGQRCVSGDGWREEGANKDEVCLLREKRKS